MNTKALDAMMGRLAPIVHEHIGKAVRPLEARIVALEQRGSGVEMLGPIREEVAKLALRVGGVEEREPVPGPAGPAGERGADAKEIDLAEVERLVDITVQRAVASLPIPENGKDADPALIEKTVADAVAALPPALDGKSITVEDVRPVLEEMVAAIPVQNGKDADPAEVERVVGIAVERAVASLPRPENGKDGKDGIGLAGAVINRDGHLVVTMSDGQVFDVGPVVGKDGAPGVAGKDGVDGLGVSDLDASYDGKRTISLSWNNGDRAEIRSFRFPASIDAGVWKEGSYEAGDEVTHRGSVWIALKDTSKQPDTAPTDWRMKMRKPRDGRDGKPGEKGLRGERGERGEKGDRGYSV